MGQYLQEGWAECVVTGREYPWLRPPTLYIRKRLLCVLPALVILPRDPKTEKELLLLKPEGRGWSFTLSSPCPWHPEQPSSDCCL